MMELKTAQLIIAQAADLSVPALKFNWKGEATLNPHFPAITKFAKEHASGYTFQDRLLNSNFKFPWNKDEIFEGLCNQTKVKVSFDSFIPEIFARQRKGANYDEVLFNITRFYNWKGRTTELVIQSVRTKLNKDEDIEGEVKRRWPSAGISIRDMVLGRIESQAVKDLEHRERDFSERQSCIQAHSRLVFNWDGIAFPCCVDIAESMPLGDIKATDLHEIFRSHRANELRKSLLNKSAFKCGPCDKCPSFETFKGYKPPWNS